MYYHSPFHNSSSTLHPTTIPSLSRGWISELRGRKGSKLGEWKGMKFNDKGNLVLRVKERAWMQGEGHIYRKRRNDNARTIIADSPTLSAWTWYTQELKSNTWRFKYLIITQKYVEPIQQIGHMTNSLHTRSFSECLKRQLRRIIFYRIFYKVWACWLDGCHSVVFTISTNNQTFRPTQPSVYYIIATCFGPLLGPSSGYRIRTFKNANTYTNSILLLWVPIITVVYLHILIHIQLWIWI
jgi:hypothetical protein